MQYCSKGKIRPSLDMKSLTQQTGTVFGILHWKGTVRRSSRTFVRLSGGSTRKKPLTSVLTQLTVTF